MNYSDQPGCWSAPRLYDEVISVRCERVMRVRLPVPHASPPLPPPTVFVSRSSTMCRCVRPSDPASPRTVCSLRLYVELVGIAWNSSPAILDCCCSFADTPTGGATARTHGAIFTYVASLRYIPPPASLSQGSFRGERVETPFPLLKSCRNACERRSCC